jgi:hypothetical protein
MGLDGLINQVNNSKLLQNFCKTSALWLQMGLDGIRGAPFEVFSLPAVTRHDWDLLVLSRFLQRLMTSQTSGAGPGSA